MVVRLVGIKRIHFTNDSNEEINGIKIYCAYPDENVDGMMVKDFFLKEGINLPKETKVNDTVELYFNMKGKVEKVLKAN